MNNREKIRNWAYEKRGRRTAMAKLMEIHLDVLSMMLQGDHAMGQVEYEQYLELMKTVEAQEKQKEIDKQKTAKDFKHRGLVMRWAQNRCLRMTRLAKEVGFKNTNLSLSLLIRNYKKDYTDQEWQKFSAAMQRIEALEKYNDFLGMLVCMWLWNDENRRTSHRFISHKNRLIGFRKSPDGKNKNLGFHRDWNEIIDIMQKVEAYKTEKANLHEYKKAG